MKLLFKPMLAAMLVFFATSANAIPITLEISESSDFSGPKVSVSGEGIAVINEGFGSWIVNVITGLSDPYIGSDHLDKLDLNSVNVTGNAGTIYIRLTGTGFDGSQAHFTTAFGGTTNGVISAQSYADASNIAFGTGTLLSDSGNISAGAFGQQDSGGISMTGLYSLSIFARIEHSGAGQVSSFDYLVTVPEPGTLALLGIGLFGLGLARRRKI